jgi:hypothetical protein
LDPKKPARIVFADSREFDFTQKIAEVEHFHLK